MFGISKLDEAIGDVPPGSNILLVGPPMTGKSLLVRDFFYTGLKNGEGGIYISTKDTATKLYQSFKDSDRDLQPYEDAFGIIDCVSRTLPIESKESIKNVIYAASAIDMPTISIGLNEFLKKLIKEKQIDKIRVVVESLSNLLMYSNLQTVYRFLHVFTASTRAADAISIYSVEGGMHSPETIATLKQLVQMAIEIQEDGDRKMLRVSEGTGDHKWQEYVIENSQISIKGV
ncbi:MAG: RAD55 family ATPase [Candidatus Hydrothermarchaeaceae archaeon]